ncbi:hypothetical protein Q8W71_21975 [Methylobacterium sp. NEAU 140]|uniref:hypothetical protein n=1 Tax=Methylobacterium sp. NEAU 140 TaxID=3064945 RepID=UPI0027368E32|nr:hypothetical protein [Methylobacterium sp. NEAU 140]MDP4025303.1 hypothetical protein [Methylobacterium sp. NEAU 140]
MPAKPATPRAELLTLAKRVARDLRDGFSAPGALSVLGAQLAASPEAVAILLELLQAEIRKTRPNDGLVEALLTLFGAALEEARLAIESGAAGPAAEVVARARESIRAAGEAGAIPGALLMALIQQFTAAKLDPGDDLRRLMARLVEEGGGAAAGPTDIAAQYEALAAAFDGDPFLIHGQLSEQLSAFPEAQRGRVIESFVVSDVPAMREAALGWLLDASPSVSRPVAECLARAAEQGLVSAEAAGRMALMRPWLPEAVQAGVDRAVRACRGRAAAPAERPAIQVASVMASGCDGAGAQTFLVLVKRGRKMAFASLLAKHGYGLRDALVMEGLSMQEIGQLKAEIATGMDPFDASPEIVRDGVAHGLAVSLDRGEPPPFGLVQFLETVGLTQVRPDRIEPGALVAQLLADAPERPPAAALAASKQWSKHYAFPHSWFEDGEAAQAVLRAHRGKKERVATLLAEVLPARRARWGELLAWTAKAARDQVEDDAWVDFALVARELLGERPLAEIPIAAWIAGHTVTALTGR